MRDDFTWYDAERLIRFGAGALAEAPRLLQRRGFEGYALLTTERAAADAPALVKGAGVVLEVPSGPVPDAAAVVRAEVGERPLVALGGGRVIDSAKGIGGVDALTVAAVPTTLSGAVTSNGFTTMFESRRCCLKALPHRARAHNPQNALTEGNDRGFRTPRRDARSVDRRVPAQGRSACQRTIMARAQGRDDSESAARTP